ncbi:MAG: polyprenol monophosphomannose synthase [Candidatus Tritonobacter lacicola]|nr:polyprenol monophosphomannose synthase [Candidatus Tritonobacter lacicola]
MDNTIVFIPTYNERDNIGPLIDEIKAIGGDPGILVVDDDSPDGTWRVVEEKAARYAGVHLLRRRGERGRGGAGIAGFKRAIELGASRIVEMDGDGQHDPAAIPLMLKAIESNDVVLGSRFMPGGTDSERSLTRRVVSAFARRYINSVLGLKLSDPTTGYRCFRKTALEAIGLKNLRSKDQFIVTEMLYSCSRAGLKIGEVPIAFRRRKSGSSKLGAAALTKYLIRVILLRSRG